MAWFYTNDLDLATLKESLTPEVRDDHFDWFWLLIFLDKFYQFSRKLIWSLCLATQLFSWIIWNFREPRGLHNHFLPTWSSLLKVMQYLIENPNALKILYQAQVQSMNSEPGTPAVRHNQPRIIGLQIPFDQGLSLVDMYGSIS